MVEITQRCATCKWYAFWRDNAGKYADCKKNAPVKTRRYKGNDVAVWPMVADYDFCKEWERREE